MKHLKYLSYVIRHKWFVFVAGRRLGVPLRQLIVHDLSKFSRAEWTPYVNRFFAGKGGKLDKSADPEEFHRAWHHHWQHNPHHWEYWVKEDGQPGEMFENYAMEMAADWLGAGRAQTGKWEAFKWYQENKDKMNIAPRTQTFVERLIFIDYMERSGFLDALMDMEEL